MLTAIVRATPDLPYNGERLHLAAVRTLGRLIPLLLADLVRDAWLVGVEDPQLRRIADRAGCGFVDCARRAPDFEADFSRARCDVFFLIDAGYGPGGDFLEEMADRAPVERALRLDGEPQGLAQKLFGAPVAGLVAPRGRFVGAVAQPAALARKNKAAPLRSQARLLV